MTDAKAEGSLARSNAAAESQGWDDLASTRPPPRGRASSTSALIAEGRATETGPGLAATGEHRTVTMPSGLQVFVPERQPVSVLVSIQCAAGSQILGSTGAYLASYAAAQFAPRAGRSVALAAHELLANAVSYAAPGEVTIELFEDALGVGVRVANDALDSRLHELDEHLLRLSESPRGQQLDDQRRSAVHGRRPMLGLARIVQEARCELEIEMSGRRVTATARCRD